MRVRAIEVLKLHSLCLLKYFQELPLGGLSRLKLPKPADERSFGRLISNSRRTERALGAKRIDRRADRASRVLDYLPKTYMRRNACGRPERSGEHMRGYSQSLSLSLSLPLSLSLSLSLSPLHAPPHVRPPVPRVLTQLVPDTVCMSRRIPVSVKRVSRVHVSTC